MSRPILRYLPLPLVIGVLAFYVGTQCARPDGGPSVDSTRTILVRDTVRAADTTTQKALQTALGALGQANRTIAWLKGRTPPTVPPKPDSAPPLVDSLYARISYDSATIAVLGDTLQATRDSLAKVVDSLPKVVRALQAADRRLTVNANLIGALQRDSRKRTVVGPTYGTEGWGGFVTHDVKVLVRGQAMVQVEPGTIRGGYGFRF